MSLIDDALVIKNETVGNANTANRVGGLFEGITQNMPMMGFFDYNNSGLAQSYTNGNLVLQNNGGGAFTNTSYKPEGVNSVYNTNTHQFDFSELSLGDTIDLRIDVLADLLSNNQTVTIKMRLGIGSLSEYTLPFILDRSYKTSGVKELLRYNGFYIGNTDTLNFPAQLEFTSDGGASVTVIGYYIRILKKSKISVG